MRACARARVCVWGGGGCYYADGTRRDSVGCRTEELEVESFLLQGLRFRFHVSQTALTAAMVAVKLINRTGRDSVGLSVSEQLGGTQGGRGMGIAS